MGLRNRTLQMVALLLLAISAAGGLIGLKLIYPRFVALEQQHARDNAELVTELLDRELQLLSPQAEDWSFWDATYDFATSGDGAYIVENLDIETQVSLKAEFMGFYDANGGRIWSRSIDTRDGVPRALPGLDQPALPVGHALRAAGDAAEVRSGLLATPAGPMLVTASPILKSDRSGPMAGTLVFGRLFDLESVRRIAREGRLQVEFSPPPVVAEPAPAASGQAGIRHGRFDFRAGEHQLSGKTLLYSLDGKPALVLTVSTPRDISARGRSVLRLAAIFLILASTVCSVLLIVMLNREIVRPVQRLTELAQHVGDDVGQATRLCSERNDEIGELGREFDNMLDRLADARRRLLEQSYKAGASEMAGGIIRDLRESLGPLKARLESPLRLLDQAQSSTQLMLLHQLAELDSNRPKFAEVLQMLQEGVDTQASLLSEARGELRLVRRQLEQTQETLNEYARYLNSKASMAPVSLSAALDGALRQLSPLLRASLVLDIDESVARVGTVVAARELLQQVLHLLMAGAAQALQATPGRQGSLRITASIETGADGEYLHVRFDDNRPTPSAENIAAMFEPNASAVQHVDGLSLNWAASVVTAMNGELRASASQPFDGLVVHLLLPHARD